MASDLWWRPKLPPSGNPLSRQLKYVISQHYFGHDGSLSGEVTLTGADISFLSGIVAASPNEECRNAAQELIDAIELHGTIELELRQ